MLPFFRKSPFSPFLLVNYLLLFGISLIWGAQYFFNKIALECFSGEIITAVRVTLGAAFLTMLIVANLEQSSDRKHQGSSWRYLPDFIVIGFFEATLPCLLIAWAQKQVSSSVTAILLGTVPLFATLLEALFIKDHPLSKQKAFAILLGFLGVVILVGPGYCDRALIGTIALSLPLLPVLALLSAASCFAISVSLIKARLGRKVPPLHAAQGILVGATMTALPFLFCLKGIPSFSSFHATPASFTALMLLGIFGGGVVYTLYIRLINRAGPSFASSANYLALPIGAFVGITFAQEKLTINVMASLLLILVALWFSSGKQK